MPKNDYQRVEGGSSSGMSGKSTTTLGALARTDTLRTGSLIWLPTPSTHLNLTGKSTIAASDAPRDPGHVVISARTSHPCALMRIQQTTVANGEVGWNVVAMMHTSYSMSKPMWSNPHNGHTVEDYHVPVTNFWIETDGTPWASKPGYILLELVKWTYSDSIEISVFKQPVLYANPTVWLVMLDQAEKLLHPSQRSDRISIAQARSAMYTALAHSAMQQGQLEQERQLEEERQLYLSSSMQNDKRAKESHSVQGRVKGKAKAPAVEEDLPVSIIKEKREEDDPDSPGKGPPPVFSRTAPPGKSYASVSASTTKPSSKPQPQHGTTNRPSGVPWLSPSSSSDTSETSNQSETCPEGVEYLSDGTVLVRGVPERFRLPIGHPEMDDWLVDYWNQGAREAERKKLEDNLPTTIASWQGGLA